MKYRPEIDGLRAVAVVPVILFHAGFSSFSGGFVGVDIFFVISGYLITTILLEDLRKGQFSLIEFYERRARRILPALFFMMIVITPIAWALFSEIKMKNFALGMISTTFFVSNFFFWATSGYFELSSEYQPLLHTWSLAVEEQYYIVFPVLLFLLWKFARGSIFWVLLGVSIVSLMATEIGWRAFPSFNFYLAPTRAWELLSGSMAAYIIQKRGQLENQWLALAGLLMVLASIFVFDVSTPFPSIFTVLPVGGVFLIILYAKHGTWAATILGNRAFVGIGLVSYSAYLWHQPLFAFTRLVSVEEVSHWLMAFLILATFACAYLSWRYIERPFRARGEGGFSRAQIFRFSGAGMAVTTGIAAFFFVFPVVLQPGLAKEPESRRDVTTELGEKAFETMQITKSSSFNNAKAIRPKGEAKCSVLVFGDSHAGHLEGFAEVISDERGCLVDIWTSTGCPPLFGHYKVFDVNQLIAPSRQAACSEQIKTWESLIETRGSSYDLIMLSSRWNWLIGDDEYSWSTVRQDAVLPLGVTEVDMDARIPNLATGLKQTVDKMSETGANLAIFTQVPLQLVDLREFGDAVAYEKAAPERRHALQRHQLFEESLKLAGLAKEDKARVVDLFPFFCPENEASCRNTEGENALFYDKDHLSVYGSYKLAEWFLENHSDLLETSQ